MVHCMLFWIVLHTSLSWAGHNSNGAHFPSNDTKNNTATLSLALPNILTTGLRDALTGVMEDEVKSASSENVHTDDPRSTSAEAGDGAHTLPATVPYSSADNISTQSVVNAADFSHTLPEVTAVGTSDNVRMLPAITPANTNATVHVMSTALPFVASHGVLVYMPEQSKAVFEVHVTRKLDGGFLTRVVLKKTKWWFESISWLVG